ncbi:MAG: hypothetical protein R2843_09790 [Thermomicrobiales bacterium]
MSDVAESASQDDSDHESNTSGTGANDAAMEENEANAELFDLNVEVCILGCGTGGENDEILDLDLDLCLLGCTEDDAGSQDGGIDLDVDPCITLSDGCNNTGDEGTTDDDGLIDAVVDPCITLGDGCLHWRSGHLGR